MWWWQTRDQGLLAQPCISQSNLPESGLGNFDVTTFKANVHLNKIIRTAFRIILICFISFGRFLCSFILEWFDILRQSGRILYPPIINSKSWNKLLCLICHNIIKFKSSLNYFSILVQIEQTRNLISWKLVKHERLELILWGIERLLSGN